jgi:hypothetical protein
VLDKTGTVTKGLMELAELVALNGAARAEVLRLAARSSRQTRLLSPQLIGPNYLLRRLGRGASEVPFFARYSRIWAIQPSRTTTDWKMTGSRCVRAYSINADDETIGADWDEFDGSVLVLLAPAGARPI